MKVTIFGSTGALGLECLRESLAAGHEVCVLARTPSKLPSDLRGRITLHEGDALEADAVQRALEGGCDAVLFAIGIDKHSPENLCTDITRHIFNAMRKNETKRFVWCGGGSNPVEQDEPTLGSRFVQLFASTFMGLRHRDKVRQLELLAENGDIDWVGVRPLQMRSGPRTGQYRLGFDRYSGLSKISFADCAHAMVTMLDDDTWLRKAPIIQY